MSNWYNQYKIAQKDLSQDIANLLISAKKNTGQFNYDNFLSKIVSRIIDQQTFDNSLKKGIVLALKLLKLNGMTSKMAEVVDQIRYNFKAEPPIQNRIDVENEVSWERSSPKSEEVLGETETLNEVPLSKEEQNVATGPTKIL